MKRYILSYSTLLDIISRKAKFSHKGDQTSILANKQVNSHVTQSDFQTHLHYSPRLRLRTFWALHNFHRIFQIKIRYQISNFKATYRVNFSFCAYVLLYFHPDLPIISLSRLHMNSFFLQL